jgi:PadR family transcriptional regulator, regulatory protein AphA
MKSGGASYLILGALRGDPRSGYEIKALVDRAFRFFWAVSYGQIYPELRRLKEEGLIEATGTEDGGRRRVRYELTPSGRKTLVDWLRTPTAGYELRDEGLLKLFFADALEPADALALVRTFKAARQATLDRLREIEAHTAARSHAGFPAVVLEYGIAHHEWAVDWCSRLEQRLEAAPSETEEVAR